MTTFSQYFNFQTKNEEFMKFLYILVSHLKVKSYIHKKNPEVRAQIIF